MGERGHLFACGPRQAQQHQQLPFQGGHLGVSKTVVCGSVLCAGSAGQGWVRALPRAKGLKILFPAPRLTGRRTPRSGRTSTSGKGGEGRARITEAEHRSGSKSQKEPSCWNRAVKRGDNPHLDPPSVLSKRQCSFYYSVVM